MLEKLLDPEKKDVRLLPGDKNKHLSYETQSKIIKLCSEVQSNKDQGKGVSGLTPNAVYDIEELVYEVAEKELLNNMKTYSQIRINTLKSLVDITEKSRDSEAAIKRRADQVLNSLKARIDYKSFINLKFCCVQEEEGTNMVIIEKLKDLWGYLKVTREEYIRAHDAAMQTMPQLAMVSIVKMQGLVTKYSGMAESVQENLDNAEQVKASIIQILRFKIRAFKELQALVEKLKKQCFEKKDPFIGNLNRN